MPTDGHWDAIREHEEFTRRAELERLAERALNEMRNGPVPQRPRSQTPASLPDLVSTSSISSMSESQADKILAITYRRSPLDQHLEPTYLVVWSNRGINNPTWEPLSHLVHEWGAVLEAHAFFGLPEPEFPSYDA
jgi:hypothetical protein